MIEIRSYRRVFDLERRIYRVDRVRLNPGGIPVRGVVYFVAIVLASLSLGALPLLGGAAARLPWYLRDLALPALGAALLSAIRVEGRPFHLAARAVLRFRLGPRRLAGLSRHPRGSAPAQCWRPTALLMLPDGSDARLRRLSYKGPGALVVRVAHQRRLSGGVFARPGFRPVLVLSADPRAIGPVEGEVVVVAREGRLKVE